MSEAEAGQISFVPVVKKNEGFGVGVIDVTLSHGLSLVIDEEKHVSSFHFGGLMKSLSYDEKGYLRPEFLSKRKKLGVLLDDISLGFQNLKELIQQKKISLPDTIKASTFNPFLARIYRGLPDSTVELELFLPDKLQYITVPEVELPDLLAEIPDGLKYSLYYTYQRDLSQYQDRGAAVIDFVNNIVQPRISQMRQRLTPNADSI